MHEAATTANKPILFEGEIIATVPDWPSRIKALTLAMKSKGQLVEKKATIKLDLSKIYRMSNGSHSKKPS